MISFFIKKKKNCWFKGHAIECSEHRLFFSNIKYKRFFGPTFYSKKGPKNGLQETYVAKLKAEKHFNGGGTSCDHKKQLGGVKG